MAKLLQSRRETVLGRFLRMPLTVRFVNRKIFNEGSGSRDEVVTNSRLILILRGKMTYSMERKIFHLEESTQFFVPAWTRRVWVVPPQNTCEIAWCEFDDDALETTETACVQRRLDGRAMTREKRSHLELLTLYQNSHDTKERSIAQLGMEAMLKGALGRFWMLADEKTESSVNLSTPALHPAIKHTLRWLDVHYRDRDVLESIYDQCDLTPNYFRSHFKDGMRCSPQEYVQRLRLRHARHLIHSTHWQQKRIASEVGYDDPLYFSRLYTRFWGHSPSQERTMVGSGPSK